MTNKQCMGCGVQLQDLHKTEIGYTPSLEQDYCQRCFRLTHYDDITLYVKQGESDPHVYEQIRNMDCLVVWVVDLFDFEGSLIAGLARHIGNKDVLLVGTKRDLLPTTLSDQKLGRWLQGRLKQEEIKVRGIVVTASHGRDGIDHVREAISQLSKGRSIVFMGTANVGKSTLLNALLQQTGITTSRYPGTTIDMVKLESAFGTLYDTPGVMRKDNIVHYLDLKEIKNVIPQKTVKPKNYQLYEPQTLSIGGMVRIDFPAGIPTTVTCYFHDLIPIHRGKYERADGLWEKHYGELLAPVTTAAASFAEFQRYDISLEGTDKVDIMIHGLGWVCIASAKQRIAVYVPKQIGFTKTRARV